MGTLEGREALCGLQASLGVCCGFAGGSVSWDSVAKLTGS